MPFRKLLSWFLNVVAWDGLLPAAMILLSIGLRRTLVNHPRCFEAAAVAIPIAVFFVRFSKGAFHISQNDCGPKMRVLQLVLLVLAILLLAVIDCFMVLVPWDQLFASKEDRVIWMILGCAYLSIMTIVWYPGFKRERIGSVSHAQPLLHE